MDQSSFFLFLDSNLLFMLERQEEPPEGGRWGRCLPCGFFHQTFGSHVHAAKTLLPIVSWEISPSSDSYSRRVHIPSPSLMDAPNLLDPDSNFG